MCVRLKGTVDSEKDKGCLLQPPVYQSPCIGNVDEIRQAAAQYAVPPLREGNTPFIAGKAKVV